MRSYLLHFHIVLLFVTSVHASDESLWNICRELPFQKGDIVYIIRQVDQNWYEGEHHGRVGIFPQSYVEVCEFSPSFFSRNIYLSKKM